MFMEQNSVFLFYVNSLHKVYGICCRQKSKTVKDKNVQLFSSIRFLSEIACYVLLNHSKY